MQNCNNDLRRKIQNQEKVNRSLNQDVLEDKENVPQHKVMTTKLYTLTQELSSINIKQKFDLTTQDNKIYKNFIHMTHFSIQKNKKKNLHHQSGQKFILFQAFQERK